MAKTPSPTQGVPEIKYVPRVFVDLTKSDIDELKGLKIGEKARVVITGKIVELSQRSNSDGRVGTIAVENYEVMVKDAPGGEMEELAEEDD